jgi:hypothetical protein
MPQKSQKKKPARPSKSPQVARPSKQTKTERPSKSAFVRGLPADLPAKVVVTKGKEHGITLTEKYVYAVRAAARVAKKKVAAPVKAAPPPKSAKATEQRDVHHAEDLLRAAAAELGLSRAIDLLTAERKKVLKVLG